MILTEKEFKALEPYEKNMSTAIRAGWARNPGSSALDLMQTVYGRVSGTAMKINKGCGTCILNLLKDLTGSYGLAIILLTVLVKLVLWPLIHKGNKSMRRMQRIQPLVKELKEKYKDNQPEFSRQMMELYKKENVSPFGGCFPMLLQLPVFIALYSTLDSSVELRHVSFLWAQDLSRPDLVGPTIFGIGLHPFILISTGLMVLQQKLAPPMADPMQHKMMMLMPVIMLVFFYNFPSGLALYWTVNNILSILQMKYSQYAAKKEELALNAKSA